MVDKPCLKIMPTEELERPYQTIFETLSDGVIIQDAQTGLIIEANPAASAMHGYSHQQFIGLYPLSFIYLDSMSLFDEYRQTAQPDSVFQTTVIHRHRDGTLFNVELRGTAFTYQQRPCLLSVIRDVSDRMQRERQLARRVTARLAEQASLSTLQERQRLAQNLHDAVNQSLFSASIIAEVLPRLWERDPEQGRESLEDLRLLTRGAMAEMRSLLAELRPLVLTDSNLGDLLGQLRDAFIGRTNISVQLNVTGKTAVPAHVQATLYHICQEALNNIAKHAAATEVAITLHYDATAAELRVGDNGRGFDPLNTPAGHFGLSMMNERAKTIGAQFTVTSQRGAGTEIVVHWQKKSKKEAL